VILGGTGRNFAAGMSGGVAYVFDDGGSFASRCNASHVDLDPMQVDDLNELRLLLRRHVQLTGSAVAARLLAEWPAVAGTFVKVMPRDYKRVLRSARPVPDTAVKAQAVNG
jgi:glutamate synthase domain-containing protein 3